MAGYLGSDFDPLQPEDSDSVKFGASWIRDFKRRVKLFATPLFNLETGALRDGVIRHASLQDMVGLTPDTYNRVKVNSKGLVTEGLNTSEQQAATYYTAYFSAAGDYMYETTTGLVHGNGAVDSIYLRSGSYNGTGAPFSPAATYPVSGNFAEFIFTPPAGVRRIKATIIGGGGGAYFPGGVSNPTSANWFGGGGGELVQTSFALDGAGQTSLSIIVGEGGINGDSSTANTDGCPSRVALSDTVYADAGCGKKASSSAAGNVVEGQANTSVLGVLRSVGLVGGTNFGGLSGSLAIDRGMGGAAGVSPGDGWVILEWVL